MNCQFSTGQFDAILAQFETILAQFDTIMAQVDILCYTAPILCQTVPCAKNLQKILVIFIMPNCAHIVLYCANIAPNCVINVPNVYNVYAVWAQFIRIVAQFWHILALNFLFHWGVNDNHVLCWWHGYHIKWQRVVLSSGKNVCLP